MYTDATVLPTVYLELKFGRSQKEVNITYLKGIKNFTVGTEFKDNAETRYVEIDEDHFDNNVLALRSTTDRARYTGTADPAWKVFQLKRYLSDEHHMAYSKIYPYGWIKRLYVMQRDVSVNSTARPFYTHAECGWYLPASDYSNGGGIPVSIYPRGLYASLQMFLCNAGAAMGYRQMYGIRGTEAIAYTLGLVAEQVNPDRRRGIKRSTGTTV